MPAFMLDTDPDRARVVGAHHAPARDVSAVAAPARDVSAVAAPARDVSAVARDTVDTLVPGGRYVLGIRRDPASRIEAQRLRYRVFGAEPGYSIPESADGLDADAFDDHCDHLLVRDRETGGVVACHRLLTPVGAAAAGGYYSAGEFALADSLLDLRDTVEMGRVCIEAEHRNGSVLTAMWAATLDYLRERGHGRLMGCVSMPLAAGLPNVRAVRDHVLADAPPLVAPLRRVVVDGVSLDDVEPAAGARPGLPPVLRGYLRLGARVVSEPSHDPEFGVADFLTVLDLDRADVRYLERLGALAGRGVPSGHAS